MIDLDSYLYKKCEIENKDDDFIIVLKVLRFLEDRGIEFSIRNDYNFGIAHCPVDVNDALEYSCDRIAKLAEIRKSTPNMVIEFEEFVKNTNLPLQCTAINKNGKQCKNVVWEPCYLDFEHFKLTKYEELKNCKCKIHGGIE